MLTGEVCWPCQQTYPRALDIIFLIVKFVFLCKYISGEFHYWHIPPWLLARDVTPLHLPNKLSFQDEGVQTLELGEIIKANGTLFL